MCNDTTAFYGQKCTLSGIIDVCRDKSVNILSNTCICSDEYVEVQYGQACINGSMLDNACRSGQSNNGELCYCGGQGQLLITTPADCEGGTIHLCAPNIAVEIGVQCFCGKNIATAGDLCDSKLIDATLIQKCIWQNGVCTDASADCGTTKECMCGVTKLAKGQLCVGTDGGNPQPGYNSNCSITLDNGCVVGTVCDTKSGKCVQDVGSSCSGNMICAAGLECLDM